MFKEAYEVAECLILESHKIPSFTRKRVVALAKAIEKELIETGIWVNKSLHADKLGITCSNCGEFHKDDELCSKCGQDPTNQTSV